MKGDCKIHVRPFILHYENMGQILNLFKHILQDKNKLSQNYIFRNSDCMHMCVGDMVEYAGGQWLACAHASVTKDCLLVWLLFP
jgi:hypothetical protein